MVSETELVLSPVQRWLKVSGGKSLKTIGFGVFLLGKN
jgi:hypothetical protein